MELDERIAIARFMATLPEADRSAAIDAGDNVLDERERFAHKRKQVEIARGYRRPILGAPVA